MTDTQTPERIWINSKCPPTDRDWNYCSTEDDFDEVGIQYVRKDLHAAVVAERDQLKADLAKLTRPKSDNQPDIAYWKFRFAEAAEERDQLKAMNDEKMQHIRELQDRLTELEKHRV